MKAIQLGKEIRAAIQQGDLNQVKTLIGSSKKRLEMMTGLGTWLNVAASVGNMEIAKHLVALGADINRRGGLAENAPITTAAWMGHAKIVRYLLSCGAKIDVSDRERNPLFNAIEGGYIDIVKLLIDHGIDTRVKYTDEFTKDMDALAFARLHGQKKIAALLAKIGKKKPDYAAFERVLKKAVTLHFAKLSKTLARDRCNAYCLYTSDDVSSIGPVANRASKVLVKPGKPLYNYYRYSADEWSDWDDFGLFSDVDDWIRQHAEAEEYSSTIAPKLLNVCVDVLAELKIAGLFNDALPDLFLIVWVSDSSNRVMQESAARLNSPKAYKAYAAEFVSSDYPHRPMKVKLTNGRIAAQRDIAALQKIIGRSLPSDVLQFMAGNDGAEPETNIFQIGKDNDSGVDGFIPVKKIAKEIQQFDKLPSGSFPVAWAAGGNYVIVNKAANVLFWDHETDELVKLAKTFRSFLELLEPFDVNSIELNMDGVTIVSMDHAFVKKCRDRENR